MFHIKFTIIKGYGFKYFMSSSTKVIVLIKFTDYVFTSSCFDLFYNSNNFSSLYYYYNSLYNEKHYLLCAWILQLAFVYEEKFKNVILFCYLVQSPYCPLEYNYWNSFLIVVSRWIVKEQDKLLIAKNNWKICLHEIK